MVVRKSMLKNVLFVLFAAIFSFGLFISAPQPVSAQEACQCWCETPSGAVVKGTGKTGQDPKTACSSHCAAANGLPLACVKVGEKPATFARCWTQQECTSSQVVLPDGSTGQSTWAPNSTPECPTAEFSDKKQEERHCYNPPIPVSLNIAINTLGGDGKTAFGLAEYIDALYQLLIPSAAIIAVVLLMIAGLQYMLARGNQEVISKAKDRMSKTVIGIVLILGAYSIANFIDPGLTSFDPLRVPRIRPVLFLDPNSSCEVLSEFFEIKKLGEGIECGDTGELGDPKEGVGADIAGDLTTGAICNYTKCDGEAKHCVSGGGSSTDLFCARCADSYDDLGGDPNPEAPPPTPDACQQFSRVPVGVTPSPGEKFLCAYDNFGGDECIELVYPDDQSATSLDCDKLRADAAAAGTESCRAYDLVGLLRSGFTEGYQLDDIDSFYSSAGVVDLPGSSLLENICVNDICGLSATGGCQVVDTTVRIDCITPGDGVATSDIVQDTLGAITSGAASFLGLDDPESYDFSTNNCTDVHGQKVNCQNGW